MALDLIAGWHGRRQAVASTQVLQEYFVMAPRKLGVPVDIAPPQERALFARMYLFRQGTEGMVAAVDLHRL